VNWPFQVLRVKNEAKRGKVLGRFGFISDPFGFFVVRRGLRRFERRLLRPLSLHFFSTFIILIFALLGFTVS
jgi:hypothetical protein